MPIVPFCPCRDANLSPTCGILIERTYATEHLTCEVPSWSDCQSLGHTALRPGNERASMPPEMLADVCRTSASRRCRSEATGHRRNTHPHLDVALALVVGGQQHLNAPKTEPVSE